MKRRLTLVLAGALLLGFPAALAAGGVSFATFVRQIVTQARDRA